MYYETLIPEELQDGLKASECSRIEKLANKFGFLGILSIFYIFATIMSGISFLLWESNISIFFLVFFGLPVLLFFWLTVSAYKEMMKYVKKVTKRIQDNI